LQKGPLVEFAWAAEHIAALRGRSEAEERVLSFDFESEAIVLEVTKRIKNRGDSGVLTVQVAAFSETERKDHIIQMRPRRIAAKIYTAPSKSPVPSIITVSAMASLSTLEKTTPSFCTQESFDRKGMQIQASS